MKKIFALLLATLMILSMTACADREPQPADEESSSPSSSQQSSSKEEEPQEKYELPDFPDHGEDIAATKAINDDTVGWLRIPGTTVDDAVVCYMDPNDYNQYYLRKDINKNYSMEGVYYADCRNQFDGTAAGLSQNTTIYGHALDMNDDPNEIRFSQLKKFWDIDFAKEHPYIYFSTEEEDLVWEIFATFFTTFEHDYINPLDGFSAQQIETFLDEIRARSDYNYNVEVTPEDKFLTLSTCVYKLSPGRYPNEYRYVVMAKLVTDDNFKKEADLEVNPNVLGPKEKYTG
ncbi:MAG: class B sortase [Oscillospiraceae bacterium]